MSHEIQIQGIERFYEAFKKKMADWEARCASGHRDVFEGRRDISEFRRKSRDEFMAIHSAFCSPEFGAEGGNSFSTKPTYDAEELTSIELVDESRAYVYAKRALGQAYFQDFRYEILFRNDGTMRFRKREFHYLNEEMKREWTDASF